MLRRILSNPLGELLTLSLLILLLIVCGSPHAFAQVVSAPATAPTIVQVQPFLHDVLMLVGIVVIAVLPFIVQPVAKAAAQHFHLSNTTAVSAVLTKLAYDAANYGIAYCDSQVTKVRGINVGDPKIASAANWLLTHASDEIEHLNLSNQEVIDTVKAILPQALAATPLRAGTATAAT
ncbi:MAG TPA: hypothetical protein VLI90_08190 [Tepidisphaeraceae bacterium]|nr:hypothetical protein [Tepidisphaeraceae bacterium]